MASIGELLKEEWKNREGFVIFTTVSKDGVPNSVYIGFASLYDDETFLVADNKLFKTKENVLNGNHKGAALFITKEKKAYQVKGSLEYYTEGKYFDDMKKWNREDLPGHGVALIKIEEVYTGAEKLK